MKKKNRPLRTATTTALHDR